MQTEIVANLLLVDDDAENLASLQLALESDGHHVSIAGDASRAMEMLMSEPIELVVTDYEMPGMDGTEFCRQVRAQPAHRDAVRRSRTRVCPTLLDAFFASLHLSSVSRQPSGPRLPGAVPVARARRSDDVRKPEK
jgi:CheY-like chemotaxis protein